MSAGSQEPRSPWRYALRSLPAVLSAIVIAMLQTKPDQVVSDAAAWLRFLWLAPLGLWLLTPHTDTILILIFGIVMFGSLAWSVWPLWKRSKGSLRENIGIVLAVGITCLVIGLVGSRLIPYPPDVYSPPARGVDAPMSVAVLPTSLRIFFRDGRPEKLDASNMDYFYQWTRKQEKNPKYNLPQPQQQPTQPSPTYPFSPAPLLFQLTPPCPAPPIAPTEPEYIYPYSLVLFLSFNHPIVYDHILTDYHGAKLPEPEIVKQTDKFVMLHIPQDFNDGLIDIRLVGH
jgi:hypothetical protein